MEGTKSFKEQIKTHLDGMAADDAMFAQKYANGNKSLDECVTYILNEVYKSGKNGFADEEIYCLAVHYYDEENIKVEKEVSPADIKIVSNYETSKEDEETAKAAALKRLQDEAYERLRAKQAAKKKAAEPQVQQQPTLFSHATEN